MNVSPKIKASIATGMLMLLVGLCIIFPVIIKCVVFILIGIVIAGVWAQTWRILYRAFGGW